MVLKESHGADFYFLPSKVTVKVDEASDLIVACVSFTHRNVHPAQRKTAKLRTLFEALVFMNIVAHLQV